MKALLLKAARKNVRIDDDLPAVVLECRSQRLLKGHRLGGDDMHQRSTLETGEDRAVDLLLPGFITQDETATRPTQGLVCGARHDMRMADRGWVKPRNHQPCNVCNIGKQHSVDLVRNLSEASEVDRAGISGRPALNHLGDGAPPRDDALHRSQCIRLPCSHHRQ